MTFQDTHEHESAIFRAKEVLLNYEFQQNRKMDEGWLSVLRRGSLAGPGLSIALVFR